MKRLKKVYRIPTLFALTLIAVALGLGITVDYFNTKQQTELKMLYAPKKLAVVNVSDSQFALTWQTNVPASGLVVFGTDQSLSQAAKDLRDSSNAPSTQFTSHFVPIFKLEPNTTYFYQIKSQNTLYPNKPLSFRTGPVINSLKPAAQPLLGSVVSADQKPLSDALVFLDIPGASQLATITTTGGNFILPLKDLRTKDLSRTFDIETDDTDAQLVILYESQTSRNKIKLPAVEEALRSLVIGQDLDLRSFQPPIVSSNSAAQIPKNKYDLNGDGKINALDLSVVVQGMGRLAVNSKADLNDDGKIDQKDLDLIRKQAQ